MHVIMDTLTLIFTIVIVWTTIYIVSQAIGLEKLNEKGVDAGTPFFLMFKTERLNSFLTRAGKRFPKLFWNIGIVVAFIGMALGFYIFTDNLLKLFFAPVEAGGVVPIIPGITITGLPLFYMMIGLGITLITHEFAHGMAASKDDIPVKSSGLLFFFLLFGGFVEPDEEVYEKKATSKQRMRLLAAGSYANLIAAVFLLLIIMNFNPIMSVAFNQPSGAFIYETETGTAGGAALEFGDVIIGLNDTVIESWADVGEFMSTAPVGAQVTIETLDGSVIVILGQHPDNASRGYIGVFGADYWEPKPGWNLFLSPLYVFHLQQTLFWTWIILVSVGLFNLLPIPLFDGDKILRESLRLTVKDERKIQYIMWPARIIAVSIVVLSIGLSLYLGKGLF
ncbi:MAG: hypothetical protein EAX81_02465 [Candidatus Thorarchaeota archaeon]|nr:hypothetical protein [Candidatus Thorarchaeota archaeon]